MNRLPVNSDADQFSRQPALILIAKELLPLPALVRKLGDWDQGVCANLCPFHDDHKPSFSIFKYEGYWYWKCHACGEQGDEITYLELKLELTRGDAIRRFLEMAGVRNPPERRCR